MEMGLPHELFFGVDGRTSLPETFEHLVDRSARVNRSQRPMTDGEYACALSHIFIYRLLVERGISRAIVLEDDAIVGTSFAAFAAGEIAAVGDLLLLDHRQGLYRRVAPLPLGHGFKAHRVAAAPNLSTGYAITQAAASHFLKNALPVRMLADWSCDIRRIESFAIHPRLVEHVDIDTGCSTIRERRDDLASRYDAGFGTAWQRWRRPAYWRRWLAKRWFRRLDTASQLEVLQRSGAAGEGHS